MEGHKIKIVFDDYGVTTKLICPESGCTPATTCSQCGRDFQDKETEPCYDCRGLSQPISCWLRSWWDNEDLAQEGYIHGQVVVDVAHADWDMDHPDIKLIVQEEVK